VNKKIVYITSFFPFGISESWAYNEINSLLEQGNEIIIIPRTGKGKIINKDSIKFASHLIDLPFLNWSIFIFLIRTILFNSLPFLKLSVDIVKQSNSMFDFVKGLVILPKSLYAVKILKHKKIDHIHSLSTTSTAVMAHIISSDLNLPWSYTLHSSSVLNSNYKRSFLFQSNSASKCRTISEITANDLSTFIGPLSSKKVVNVNLGVDIRDFKKEKNIVNNPVIIAMPAGLKVHKGHSYAIEAAKKLIERKVYNFKWVFYGSGPLLNELKKKVKEFNLINHCYFPGNIDHKELLDKYKRNEVDIVISSSITTQEVFEGIPVSLMEAMSYGIPVIATDCGATRELVDGKSGILVNQNDANSVSTAIIRLINNPEYYREIGRNGRNKINQDFDTVKNAHDLIKMF
jgi:glycosyltransferase involved in cell wall biosynthesis